ncbi:hypothetical protein AN958_03184 [Leucoagaricus sp. SymC.cos]|nr:hypothetical protein AN958_03184 [Leucoagaricus sp. SymC.cos]
MSTKTELAEVRRGSCLCGAVRYEVQGDPIRFMTCHCINCRKATGTAFMSNGLFPRNVAQRFRLVSGQEKLKVFLDKGTTSGVPLSRHFCRECGSNVVNVSKDPEKSKQYIAVAMGSLDDDMHWLPTGQFFPEQKRHWVVGIHMAEAKPT